MKKIATAFLLAFSLSAFASEFEGTWATKCLPESDGYSVGTMGINGTAFELLGGYYEDKNCAKVAAVGRFLGEIVADSDTQDGVKDVEVIYTHAGVTLKSSTVVLYANMVALCGYSNWKLNVEKEIFGQTCFDMKIPNKGDHHYNILSLSEAGTLYSGLLTQDLDGSTPEKRPKELDTEREFHKKF